MLTNVTNREFTARFFYFVSVKGIRGKGKQQKHIHSCPVKKRCFTNCCMKKCITYVTISGLLFYSILLAACNKKEDFKSDAVADYMNLQVGKYVIYRLDSTNYVHFGQAVSVISYQAKDVVEATITDNLGRNGFRVVRYLRDTASTNDADWTASLTYQVIPSRENIEMLEWGFRYIKLVIPITEGYTWKGNGYLPESPYQDLYEFSNDQDIQTWDYTYSNVGASQTINGKTYDSTLTVTQIDDSTNVPIIAGVPASQTRWIEKYAKNVGLIYKEVVMWEYQPPTTTNSEYVHGFGIKLTILDHN